MPETQYVVVLLSDSRAIRELVGPFDTQAAATAWHSEVLPDDADDSWEIAPLTMPR